MTSLRPPEPRRSAGRIAWAPLWASMGLLFVVGCRNLPELKPLQLDGFPANVRSQIEGADKSARAVPPSSTAAGHLGMVLQAYRLAAAAEAAYLRAIALEPTSFPFHFYLGVVQSEQQHDAAAVASFREALALAPSDVETQIRLAAALGRAGQVAEAEKIYRALLANAEDRWPDVHFAFGEMLQLAGRHAEAAAAFEEACRVYPTYGPAHYAAASMYRRLGRDAEAESHLKAYEEAPQDGPTRRFNPLLEAIELLDESVTGLIARGQRLETAGHHDSAGELYERALAIEPGSFDGHRDLVWIYARLQDFDRAEKHYQAAMAIDPTSARLFIYYSVMLQAKGDWAAAERAIRRAIVLDASIPEAYVNLATIERQAGRISSAIAAYSKALTLAPRDQQLRLQLAQLLLRSGRVDDAERVLLALVDGARSPAPGLFAAIARTYREAGQREAGSVFYWRARGMFAPQGEQIAYLVELNK